MMRSEYLVEVDLIRWRRSLTPIGNMLQLATSSFTVNNVFRDEILTGVPSGHPFVSDRPDPD